MSETLTKYLRITRSEEQSGNRKTDVLIVVSRRSEILLGTIKWWGAFRAYCFFPNQYTLFDAACLRDIATFCEDHTTAHRLLKKFKGRQVTVEDIDECSPKEKEYLERSFLRHSRD